MSFTLTRCLAPDRHQFQGAARLSLLYLAPNPRSAVASAARPRDFTETVLRDGIRLACVPQYSLGAHRGAKPHGFAGGENRKP